MNRPKDTFLIMLLPQTLTAAIALTMFAVIAFRMEANTEGFVFSFFSLFAWIALVSEFFLLYDSIIDKWLSKDRSVIAATWFLLSLLLSFMLTPDKHLRLEHSHCHAVPLCRHIPPAVYGVYGLWKTHIFFFAETLE